ncbi:MAG TPA: tripartite tricarboxylate transporter substrate-binding protein [Candidatus Binatia bacterium]|jgi:tripartite-type tricarboxylate transporter receptor subunit TctC|nr:tripartite tricarboxylate transporter substrate-binding protein [Candidatus Binatia bacterium]
MTKAIFYVSLIGIIVASMSSSEDISYAQDFYAGKTIRIVVGFPAGGGFDTYSRVMGRHIGKYIPGNPAVVVDNVTGAGSLVAANSIYKATKPDGLTIGNFIGNLISQQLFGGQGIEFDARRFEWIGVPVKDHVVCALTKASGITSVDAWMAAKAPVKLGGSAPGTTNDDAAKLLKAALGLPIQLVTGYKGTAPIKLAAESGEIDGGCWAWESIKVMWRQGLDAGDAKIVLQAVPKAVPDLPKVPVAIELAKTEEARKLIQVGIHDTASITRPYALPPGTPKDRVQMLRRAFRETMKDKDFLAEAVKSKLDVDPVSGEEVEKIVAGLFKLDSATIAKMSEILK